MARRPTPAPVAEAEASLYGDPFAGSGPCRLALRIPEDRRRQATEMCPRCGARQDPAVPAEERVCLLQGVELDELALDDDDPILTFLALVRDRDVEL